MAAILSRPQCVNKLDSYGRAWPSRRMERQLRQLHGWIDNLLWSAGNTGHNAMQIWQKGYFDGLLR